MYGVTLVSRIDQIIGLFCKRALPKRRYSAKETCNFIDATDRSHPIFVHAHNTRTQNRETTRRDTQNRDTENWDTKPQWRAAMSGAQLELCIYIYI